MFQRKIQINNPYGSIGWSHREACGTRSYECIRRVTHIRPHSYTAKIAVYRQSIGTSSRNNPNWKAHQSYRQLAYKRRLFSQSKATVLYHVSKSLFHITPLVLALWPRRHNKESSALTEISHQTERRPWMKSRLREPLQNHRTILR